MAVTVHPTQWHQHEIAGHTLQEVATHIAQMAEAGQTSWHPTYHATHWDGNTIAAAQVDVTISVTMPHWAQAAGAPDAERAEWERFVQALHDHEQGHVDLAVQYLEHADTLVEGVDEHTAAQQWHDNLVALQSVSDGYDTSTAHGQNAGTVITVP